MGNVVRRLYVYLAVLALLPRRPYVSTALQGMVRESVIRHVSTEVTRDTRKAQQETTL